MGRDHTPEIDVDGINLIGHLFTVATAKEIAARVGHGLPPQIDPDGMDPALDADADEMVFAQLAGQLATAAVDWAFAVHRETGATVDMRIKLARRVKQNCAQLLNAMTDSQGNLLPSLGSGGLWALAALQGGSGSSQVSKAMTSVRDLQRWAGGMVNRLEAVEATRVDHVSESAFQELLGELGRIYVMFWRRAPGYSRPEQSRPDGPFFRFVEAVCEQLDLRRSEEALATAITRHPKLRALKEQVRGRWQ